jgi:hypothetical protein
MTSGSGVTFQKQMSHLATMGRVNITFTLTPTSVVNFTVCRRQSRLLQPRAVITPADRTRWRTAATTAQLARPCRTHTMAAITGRISISASRIVISHLPI